MLAEEMDSQGISGTNLVPKGGPDPVEEIAYQIGSRCSSDNGLLDVPVTSGLDLEPRSNECRYISNAGQNGSPIEEKVMSHKPMLLDVLIDAIETQFMGPIETDASKCVPKGRKAKMGGRKTSSASRISKKGNNRKKRRAWVHEIGSNKILNNGFNPYLLR
ncbi:hypothetical protein V6N13_004781 [Hibiscus sabdariffa]|uniref:Uncharacterized protein n=1 Tax=Hibiscus sabdariffa TaxID=183260 RepID=A0ABR2S094_9ROSI